MPQSVSVALAVLSSSLVRIAFLGVHPVFTSFVVERPSRMVTVLSFVPPRIRAFVPRKLSLTTL
jgi:hypothetical protein